MPGLTTRDDFTVFESDLECGHVQNGQSFTWSEPNILLVGYTSVEAIPPIQTEGRGKVAVYRFRRDIRSQALHALPLP